MAANEYVNKVVYGSSTLIDLTGDDVQESDVRSGVKFHLPSGEPAIGTSSGGGGGVGIYQDQDGYLVLDPSGSGGGYTPCTGLSLSSQSITFSTLDTQTLTATKTPSGASEPVAWLSSDASVATVSGGVVTPIADGDAIIYAVCGDQIAACAVTVSTIPTIGGLPVWMDNAVYDDSTAMPDVAYTNSAFFLTGVVDTGDTSEKTYTVSRIGAGTYGCMKFFNDLESQSVDYWTIMRGDMPLGTIEPYQIYGVGRYIILSVAKAYAADFYLMDSGGNYLLKGANVT